MTRESSLDKYGYSQWTRKYGIFYKVFLGIDFTLRKDDSGLFGKELEKIRREQIIFLLERPLIFKVITEKRIGPTRLNALFINEFVEAELEFRKLDRKKEVEELVDMTLLSLTHDSLNPSLSLPSQIVVLQNNWDTVAGYCEDLGINTSNLVLPATNKIETNKLRNPKEAFMLIDNEPMQMSVERMKNNWDRLKEKRERHAGWFTKKEDWWKKWLYVDKNGWVRERVH